MAPDRRLNVEPFMGAIWPGLPLKPLHDDLARLPTDRVAVGRESAAQPAPASLGRAPMPAAWPERAGAAYFVPLPK